MTRPARTQQRRWLRRRYYPLVLSVVQILFLIMFSCHDVCLCFHIQSVHALRVVRFKPVTVQSHYFVSHPRPTQQRSTPRVNEERDVPTPVRKRIIGPRLDINLTSYEGTEKKEMEWLMRTTSDLFALTTDITTSSSNTTNNATTNNTTTNNNNNKSHHGGLIMTVAQRRRAHRLMKAWAQRSETSADACQIVHHIFDRLLDMDDETAARHRNKNDVLNKVVVHHHPLVTTRTYNILLGAWAHQQQGAVEQCRDILHAMDQRAAAVAAATTTIVTQGDQPRIRPDTSSFNACIKALVRQGGSATAANDETRLHQYQQNNETWIIDEIQAMIDEMQRRSRVQDDETVKPDRRSYNSLLYALGQTSSSLSSHSIRAADRAVAILRHMWAEYDTAAVDNRETTAGHKQKRRSALRIKPNTNTYNQVLVSVARGENEGFETRLNGLLEEMIHLPDDKKCDALPDTNTFNIIMGGWLKLEQPRVLQSILSLLEVMEDMFRKGLAETRPDRCTMNTIISAYNKFGKDDAIGHALRLRDRFQKEYKVYFDSVTYNVFLDAWVKSGRPDAAQQALQTLSFMEKSAANGKMHVAPNTFSYRAVIDCLIRSQVPGLPHKAEKVLERMKEMHRNYGTERPNAAVYNTIINAWACAPKTDETVDRVLELFAEMDSGRCRDNLTAPSPNLVTYNTVLKALRTGKSKDAIRAEEILRELEERADENCGLAPDSYSYTAVINNYGRCNIDIKADKAHDLLLRMMDLNRKGLLVGNPGIHPFNAALNACAFVDGTLAEKRGAFSRAADTMNLLTECSLPDDTTYGTMLRACSALLISDDERRRELVQNLFHRACNEGVCGPLVLKQLQFAASDEQYQSLTGKIKGARITLREFPREWTRKVRLGSRNTGLAKPPPRPTFSRGTFVHVPQTW